MTVFHQKHHTTRNQTVSALEVIPGREADMKANATGTGAQVFKTTKWTQFERFLVLGSEGGSFYVSENALTKENAKNTIEVIAQYGVQAVQRIVEISESGRAHKNDPALFALAIAAAADDVETRRAAMQALPKVARIGTHVLHFAEYVEGFRGWGKLLIKGIQNWYLDKSTDSLAYQLVKYQQRDGWSHRDLLRLSHPKTDDPAKDAIFGWATKGFEALDVVERNLVPDIISAFETIKTTTDKQLVLDLIRQLRLPREALTTNWLGDSDVWAALLEDMPMTAMIRNLGNLSKHNLLGRGSSGERIVLDQLRDQTELAKARIHPISVLAAMKTYGAGHGFRGSSSWSVNQKVVDALDEAFYKCFDFVEPTNKRIMMAIDVSGSMGGATVSGIPNLTAREAVAAMAMVTARVEDGAEFFGFRRTLSPLAISPRQRLDDVMKAIAFSDFGSTDCSAPVNWAFDNKQKFDAFTVWTDNDTGTGSYYGSGRSVHASQRLAQYRDQMNVNAKMIVCATQAYDYSIADPNDPGMLDVSGFDSAVPNIISSFIQD